jgi:hypothetical protein
MLGLLERRIESVDQRLVLLAPSNAAIPEHFQNVSLDPDRHERHLQELQRLRGDIYLNDGAVRTEHLSGGLHRTPEDDNSWHLLMFKEGRRLSSCAWFLQHLNNAAFEHLRVRTCPLRHLPQWRETLSRAVNSELSRARRARLSYAEVGGWAVSVESRCTSEGLLLALAAYSLGRVLGGALGITNATVRHSSSTILKRIGGAPLEDDGTEVPPYFDPKYGCEMELLRFDSRRPSPKYAALVERLSRRLADVTVVAADAASLPDYSGATVGSAPQLSWNAALA